MNRSTLMPLIYFTVTTDLSYDQRMIRICTSLANTGYRVVLVGRRLPGSLNLIPQPFKQKRITCLFKKGPLFYAEYNFRLFVYLLFKKMDGICAIDLDTILPGLFISKIKNIPRIYDAHELFCEMKEIVTRPAIYRIWKRIERYTVPRYQLGYTVNQPIADEFMKMYGINYQVIRSISLLREIVIPEKKEKYILYQGAVNEGRAFETLIPAMKMVHAKLIICGDGNFMSQAESLVKLHGLEDKVIFKGRIPPGELRDYTLNAWIGVTLFDDKGLSNYYSLANRFFDYMHAGIPQLCVNYPVYNEINNLMAIAVLVSDLSEENLAKQLNLLLDDEKLYLQLQHNCMQARKLLNWQKEEEKLIHFYHDVFKSRR